MGRRRKNPALCNAEFVGEENHDDDIDESEDDVDDSRSSEDEESDEYESEEESEASGVDEEYEEEAPKKKLKVVPPPPIKWHKEKVNVRFTGSPRGFSMDPSLATVKIDADSPPIFEGDTEFDPNLPVKKSTNHQIGGIAITRYKNEFDFSVSVSTNLLPLEHHRSHDTAGNSGIFTVFPNESVSSIREEICGQIGDPESSLLSKYPAYNLDNLEEGITHMSTPANTPENGKVKCSLIPSGHPLVEVFSQKDGRNSNVKPLKQLDNSIKASTQDTLRLIELIRNETRKKVKGVNLYGAEFTIQRAFVENSPNDGESWKAEAELFDNIVFDKAKEDGLDTLKSLYLTFEITYRLL